jgi:hypothetical protein
MEGFKDMNKWLRFALSAVVAVILLFALVFEISIPLPVFQEAAPEVTVVGESQAVRERISIDSREDVYLHSGADLYVYSDDHSTQKLHVDGGTGAVDGESNVTLAGLLIPECATSAITGTQTLTPTASCYLLSGTDVLTLTLGSVTTGSVVRFVRTGNANLVLNAAIKASDSDLNQYDAFEALYDGTEWVQVGVSAN